MGVKWTMDGILLGACNCDWGCPCSFNAPPTKGFCEGGYVWHIQDSTFDGLSLFGLNVAWLAHSPGPLHECRATSFVIIDEKANPQQRDALLKLTRGTYGGPWRIFNAVTAKWLEPKFAPFDVHVDGLKSRAKAGQYLEVGLAPILNPVTNEIEELYLNKPTGFTSTRAAIGKSTVLRVDAGLEYDHSGQYAEFSHFHYFGEGEN